jgi:glucan endo-1,3-alpha-glucosidase
MWFRRFAKLLFGCFTGCILAGSATPALATGPHYVFAHYMVCYATYDESVDAYKREIQEAQAAGIDGFALNIGAWDNTQIYYKNRVALMYSAAEQLGTGFKLFFSVNFSETTNILDMVRSYANRTNSFRYANRLVLSAWGENDVPTAGWTGQDWTNAILGQLSKEGIPVFFIPFFYSNPVNELPNYGNGAELLGRYGDLLNGLFVWGAAGLPSQLAGCNADYTRAVREAGKTIMGSVCPTYWGCKQNGLARRYYEFDGGEGLALQWSAIIADQPDWVEICTWNDFNESTYVSPVDDPGRYFSQLQMPRRHSHAGYLELSKRYITWYKTGQPPGLDQDALFYFYRSHPKDLRASNTNDVWVGWRTGDVQDTLYTTVFAIAPAQLEINSGGSLSTNSLMAGRQELRTPFSPGPQKLTLRRGGREVLSAQGPDIMSAIQVYNFFPASGYAYGTEHLPPPPANLRVIGN